MSVLEVRDLAVELMTTAGVIRAVDGISFSIDAGQTVTIIGESGSGKSTTAMGLLRLLPDDLAVISGHAVLDGVDVVTEPKKFAKLRGRSVALIPQDAMTALSPVHTIGRQLGEAILRKGGASTADLNRRSVELLEQVRIPEPAVQLKKYPHQLSGGMLQRVLIAMALAVDPVLLVADEPTSALDVTVQAGILDLLMELQERTHVAILMITHDLGVARLVSDRIHVMKDGKFVESGEVEQIVEHPQTEYTKKLLAAVPKLGHWDGEPHHDALEAGPPSPYATDQQATVRQATSSQATTSPVTLNGAHP
ncbi:ABC transporter ATP-binding protein [Pseudarthrobacter sp. MDT3-28]|uniref:ABC transporter ATP-binding protein n=1 Tax=Pseudarthrobacter raffinosi TaxID=2953651 RepID=UPI00208E124C|nr:ABC transporter ATP-binding protein [Pseudarthrobacter sp. MDT3-28]MCO4238631.1 ABC transporter ATP-binding protein [Pseudarthrobacter sp. MDT3-28]